MEVAAAATAILVVCSITVWNTAQNDGPFVRDSITDSLLATQLFIAAGTVKRHLTNIYAKLGAVSRLDAVNRARAAGLIQLPDDSGEITRALPQA